MAAFDTFHVLAIEARGVAAMARSGTSDPYLVVKCSFSRQKFKSKVIKKTLSPKWDQEFKIFTSKAEGEIFISMFDHDFIAKDENMGELILNLKDFANGEFHEAWFPLSKEPEKKKKDPAVKGEVHLKVWFTGPQFQPGQRRGSSAEKPQKEKEESSPEKIPVKKGPLKIEDSYEMGKVLGRGAFSVVKLGIRKTNGKKYAVKCIDKKMVDKKEFQLLEREIDIMKKLQHPNIIQLMEVIDTVDTLFLVLEFCGGGELFDAIVSRGNYLEQDAAHVVRQILEAISYVHAHGIAHRDLKPENLLLSDDDGKKDSIKIADFGLSKDFQAEQMQTSCGTPDYVAPEVLLGGTYDMVVDVWSIGVITYVLLCGFPPFYGETQKELFEGILNARYDFPDPEWSSVSEEAKNFVRRLLVVDPNKRPSAEDSLQDPWLKSWSSESRKDMKRGQSFSAQKFKQYTEKYKEQNKKA